MSATTTSGFENGAARTAQAGFADAARAAASSARPSSKAASASSGALGASGASNASSEPSDLPRDENGDVMYWTPSQFKPRDYAKARQLRNEPSNSSASVERKKRNVREYTLGEEIANAITHGIGALLAIAAIPILVVHAVRDGGGVYLLAALVYTITMLVEYLMSTLYHAIAHDKAKRVFKVLDHSCIYLFIAGSYTSFCLITLAADGGIWLCLFVWVVALAGVACEAFWVFRPRWVSAVLYLLLGWSVVWFLPALIANLSAAGLWLLVAGGISYSIGCVFYVLKKVPYMHSIFHLWVLAGSVLQFLAVANFVI